MDEAFQPILVSLQRLGHLYEKQVGAETGQWDIEADLEKRTKVRLVEHTKTGVKHPQGMTWYTLDNFKLYLDNAFDQKTRNRKMVCGDSENFGLGRDFWCCKRYGHPGGCVEYH